MTLDDQPVTRFSSNKVRALLAYLAVESGRQHSRDGLANLLWPEEPHDVAHNNLRQALANLRLAIGDRTAERGLLHVTNRSISFTRPGDYWLDVDSITHLLAGCEKHRGRPAQGCEDCVRSLEQGIDLYSGELLADLTVKQSAEFEQWALLAGERLHRQALEALNSLAREHEGLGQYEPALLYAERQLAMEPWREEAHRVAMRALFATGQRTAAMAQYQACRRALADEFGAEPSAETVALFEQIRRAAPRAPGQMTPPASRAGGQAGSARGAARPAPPWLATPAIPLVGRDEELADIGRLLAEPNCRLLTLTGPGGIGKTRLGLEAARMFGSRFADGACTIALEPVNSYPELLPTLGQALHYVFRGVEDPEDETLKCLRDKNMLLIMDGFDHLLEGAALLADILASAPDVKILITSRERLRLRDEWVYEVGGLRYPGRQTRSDRAPAAESGAELESYSAVQMFMESARRANARFRPTDADKPWIVAICRAVEGMPLAIELAAAWVRVRSCAEIAQQIGQGLDLLVSSFRDAPDRHRSLTAVFDHAWCALCDDLRVILAKLSVFGGSFRAEAAAAVAGADFEKLLVLVDKSLVRTDGASRYGLHALVRQYAAEQLRQMPAEEAAARQAYCEYYFGLIREKLVVLQGERGTEARPEIELDVDNFREAGRGAILWGRSPAADAVLPRLWIWFELRELYHVGERYLRWAAEQLGQSVAAGAAPGETLLLAQLLEQRAWFCIRLGRYEEAGQLLDESKRLAASIGRSQDLLDAPYFAGMLATCVGDQDMARTSFEEALERYQTLGDTWALARVAQQLSLEPKKCVEKAMSQDFLVAGPQSW